MMYRLVFAQRAFDDLQFLLDQAPPHSWDWAKRTTHKLRADVNQLKKYPRLGAPCRTIQGLRRLVSGPFGIYYEVNDFTQSIQIYRFWSSLQGNPRQEDIL